jgi:TRAP-type transport system periplasmic protein
MAPERPAYQEGTSMKLLRRKVLAAIAAGAVTPAIMHWSAAAAEFAYRCGTGLPDEHPMCIRVREAMQKIKEESAGRLDIALYTNSVLGRENVMMSQTLAGTLDMYLLPLELLAPRNQACGISGVGFAFANYDHIWEAMDGELGDYLRGLADKVGFHAIRNCYDHGFREITSRSKPIEKPEDLTNFKIRLPVAPDLIALFHHLGAAPAPMSLNDVYTALETQAVDGQENPLILIDEAKFYEVQKYCSMTNHWWAGIHVAFGTPSWDRLPPDLQQLCDRHFNEAALRERDDWQGTTRQAAEKLKSKGLVFNSPDIAPFRAALRQSGFYQNIRSKAGDTAWALLEKYVGKLA